MYMRLVLAAILDKQSVRERFTKWPLHITILPPFEVDDKADVLCAIQDEVTKSLPITVQVGDFAVYGNNRLVQKIIPNQALQSLHKKLLRIAEVHHWDVAGRYTGNHYTPHITLHRKDECLTGEIIIDELSIVRSDGLGYKTIIGTIKGHIS